MEEVGDIGYTTAGGLIARDFGRGESCHADVALRDAINNGLVAGPRMRVATRAIAAVGQYQPFGISPDLADFPTGAQMVSGPEEARRALNMILCTPTAPLIFACSPRPT
jgi:hypothetical protein